MNIENNERIVYKDDKSTFNELLDKDGSIRIHYRNIQRLAIESWAYGGGSLGSFAHLFEQNF